MKEKTVDSIIESVQKHLDAEFGIQLPEAKIKGLAFSALKECGELHGEDKFKTYDHVGQIRKMLNEAFKLEGDDEDLFEWEDVEYFTGNLLYTMKLATRRPLDDLGRIIQKCQDSPEMKASELVNDLFMLQQNIKRNMTNTWAHLEKIQKTGVGIFITKVLKFVLKNVKKEKNS